MHKFASTTTIMAAAVAAVIATQPTPSLAQTTGAAMKSAPGSVTMAETTKVTATITAIDAASRAVTLKTPKGEQMTVFAGPEVKNFAQMKVGDQVQAEYVEALTVELKKGGGLIVGRSTDTGAMGAKPGEKPAGVVGRQVTIIADVIDLDAKKQTVTLRGPQRTVVVKVRDPEQFKRIAKGDQVEATYTEAVAIAVTPVK
jgi:hypothetical protein